MAEPFIGEIIIFAGNFAPRNYAFCDGQLLAIASNTTLFSILGTTYGGDGRTTFALPDMRGRVPVQAGTGPGLSTYTLGEATGTETVTLTQAEIPQHNHTLACNGAVGTVRNPVNNFLAGDSGADLNYSTTANTAMNPAAVTPAGSSQPHENRQPSLGINFIIALYGIFPPRS